MIIAIDFDGTLHKAPWPYIGYPVKEAVKYINKLYFEGHYIIIWTCRENQYMDEAMEWLKENNIHYHIFNDHKPNTTQKFGYSARKIYADVYIDDKQIGGLPSWRRIYKHIKRIKK